jgi:hypothetical protein
VDQSQKGQGPISPRFRGGDQEVPFLGLGQEKGIGEAHGDDKVVMEPKVTDKVAKKVTKYLALICSPLTIGCGAMPGATFSPLVGHK